MNEIGEYINSLPSPINNRSDRDDENIDQVPAKDDSQEQLDTSHDTFNIKVGEELMDQSDKNRICPVDKT